MRTKTLWILFATVVALSFGVLGWYGFEIYREMPPIPDRVVTESGRVLFTGDDIRTGQNVWQSIGGQEVGSIWGHGAYVAPDWSADWLHRELTTRVEAEGLARYGRHVTELSPAEKEAVEAEVRRATRRNTYDPATRTLVVSDGRAAAIGAVAAHYDGLFGTAASLDDLRAAYAIPRNAIPDAQRRTQLNAFFFWAAWSCGTERPGQDITYTSNWPPEPLAGNRPTSSIILWSVVSVLLLLAGIGAMVWYHAARRAEEPPPERALRDPMLGLTATPSMKAVLKYFWVVALLVVAQVLLGGIAAHYGVEGDGFYGIPLATFLPYAVARTWHVQIGIFWIATAWLATGLFIAPAVGGREPKGQKLGVNLLFGALLLVVVGSLAGEWFGVMQKLGHTQNFWFGHQGYEYVDLGRFWQILLFVGLLLWLFLVGRALLPAFKEKEGRSLLALFVVAATAIGGFYSAGLMWGQHTHLALAEYWRWWVVHLWVEGFFEVFATVVIAFLFTRLGLIRAASATRAALFTSVIYLTGGIIGTMHHLYFSGTPTGVLAFGAVFSALEIVPLVLVGWEAAENLKLARGSGWLQQYRWPILFFVAVAFWNLVGAGLFGFLINPPVALYYMQGLNTTPVHGHTALFGVYGMLGLGLLLFCLRAANPSARWREKPLALSFWAINIGLALMVGLSLLPVGLLQAGASMTHGMWYARSAEFLNTPLVNALKWLRAPGDTVFAIGMIALAWFVLGLRGGRSFEKAVSGAADPADLSPASPAGPAAKPTRV